jgi:hypothetical protein
MSNCHKPSENKESLYLHRPYMAKYRRLETIITEISSTFNNSNNNNNNNSVASVRERTVQTERPPLVGEDSPNFCG